MKPLTDTQKKILTAASKDAHQPVENHMTHIKSPAIRRQITYSMLCSGYVIADDDDGDRHYITGEGIAALGGEAPKAKADKPAKKQKKAKAKSASTDEVEPEIEPAPETDRPVKGRQLLIDLMSRDEGATGQQMVDATGWQSGAIGGTLSKIRKLIAPQVITSSKGEDGKLVYKIA